MDCGVMEKDHVAMWYLAWPGVTATSGVKKESDWSDKHLLSGGSCANRWEKAVIPNPSPVFTIFKTLDTPGLLCEGILRGLRPVQGRPI